MAAISPSGVLDSSMAVGIANISPSSLCSGSRNSSIIHAISSVVSLIGSNAFVHLYDNEIISGIIHAISGMVPLIDSNAFVHRHNIHTSAEDQKSGPGGPWDCGLNATWYQDKSSVPSNAPMGSVPKCSRCGRIGHLASIFGAPRRFEGNCAACGEYGHLCRFCVTTRRSIPMQPHANVVTASGGGCGDSSCDHDDGGSKGVIWADQKTGGMPSGGHFFALQSALTAAYLSDRMLSSIPNSPSGSTVWIGDSASSVHGTGSGKFVYNKRRPLPGEAFLLIGDGRKVKVECFGSLDVVFHCKNDMRVTLENVAVVPGLAFDLMSFNCIQEKHDILMNRDGT